MSTATSVPAPAGAQVRRSPRRLVGLVVLALIAGLVAWAAICAISAASRLRSVRSDLKATKQLLHGDRAVLEARLATNLARARSAQSLLDQPAPALLARVPFLGRSLSAEKVVADASVAALDAGLRVSRATRDLSAADGGVDLPAVSRAATVVQQAADLTADPLHQLAAQPVGWTPSVVQDGVEQARDVLLGLDDKLRQGADALQGLVGVLGGSGRRTILIGLMNNAELRGSGGLLSAFTYATADHGNLSVQPFRDVNDVAQDPDKARQVAAPPGFHQAYGSYLADTTLWKNVTISPDGPDTAAVLSAVAAASTGHRPDAVVLVDVPATAAIVSATGPVTIAGKPVTGAQLTKSLLVDAYGDGSISAKAQAERRTLLTAAATQAFKRLSHDAAATPDLLSALVDAAAGRHLVVWSARPAEQAQLQAGGIAGALPPSAMGTSGVFLHNLGDSPGNGNKLDYYVHRKLSVDVTVHPQSADIIQTLSVRNDAPTGLGPYVAGVVHPGRVQELLAAYLPSNAKVRSFTVGGSPVDVSVDRVNGLQRLTSVLTLARGQSATYRLTYQVPVVGDTLRLDLLPQPLAHPATLDLTIAAGDDAHLGTAKGIDGSGDRLHDSRAWDSGRRIAVPVRHLSWWESLGRDISHFWNHKIEL